jgi:hypothetical protein
LRRGKLAHRKVVTVTDPLHRHRHRDRLSSEGDRSAAGVSTARERSSAASKPGGAASAIERWVNEGGSLARNDEAAVGGSPPNTDAGKEARDTVAGCRNRAAQDRLQAASSGTENSRRVFERSAASWEARAHGIEEEESASGHQRMTDRELWESEERNGDFPPD